MKTFVFLTRVEAPLEKVAAFYRQPGILKQLTPPLIGFQWHYVEPLEEGSRVAFTMWFGPIPVRWEAVHENVDYNQGFTDRQQRGPFRQWVHNHSFQRADDATTCIRDEIRAEFGQGCWDGLVSRLMWLGLPFLFSYRAWVTRRALRNFA